MTDPAMDSTPRLACVFPGQGSQVVGMGLELYNSSSQARRVFEEADDTLEFHLSRLCFEGPEAELRQTINAQPALLATSIACLRAAAEFGVSIQPSFLAGHSLGEYTALVASDVLDFADAVRLVGERGRLMHEAGRIDPGGMAAIIGLDEEPVREICEESTAQIANFNCEGQIVVSGPMDAVEKAIELAKDRGAAGAVPLEVSAAFHSRLMEPTIEGMSQVIAQVELRDPQVPVVANSTAQPLTTADEVRDELLRQLCNCVLWQPSVEYMVGCGVTTFIEVGPGIVLSKLIRRIDRGARAFGMSSPDSIREAGEKL